LSDGVRQSRDFLHRNERRRDRRKKRQDEKKPAPSQTRTETGITPIGDTKEKISEDENKVDL
jgi:hypothetical protein